MDSITREQMLAVLTPAERAVVELVLQGHSNKIIASLRGSSVSTVKHQLVSVFRKLRVESRSHLIVHVMSAASRTTPPS